jgi:hypothetical protein
MLRFKYEIRKKQLKNELGQDVTVTCNNGVPTYVQGTLPNNGWINITKDVEYKPQFDFNFNNTNQKNSKEKGTTSNILISGVSKDIISGWINFDSCSYLNTYELKITDLLCGIELPHYEMKGDNLKYCVGDGCKLELPLREINAPYHCLLQTSIYDNWQGWFNGNVKDFPTFNVCVQDGNQFTLSGRIAINSILLSIPVIGQVLTGFNIVTDSEDTCREILGLDNFYSAPNVYDILQNATQKCGITMETIFDVGKPLHNACYYFPIAGNYHKNNSDIIVSPSTKFIWGNRIGKPIDEFLDEICLLTNSLWWIENGKLVVEHIEVLNNAHLLVDFNTYSIKPYDICYEANGDKYPASGDYKYQTDSKDQASNQIITRYNDRVSFTKGVGNTVFDGIKSKSTSYASTAFMCDKTESKDYIEKSFDQARIFGLVIIAILAALGLYLLSDITSPTGALIGIITAIWIAAYLAKIANLKDDIGCNQYEGSIRHISNGTIDIQRLIMWDGQSINLAKVKNYTPQIDAYYNINNVIYNTEYGVNNTRNFELMFDANFVDSLYKYHKQTDDTLLNGFTNVEVTFKLKYCCEILELFGITDGGTKKLYYNIRLPKYNNWISEAHIISISLQPIEGFIQIKAKLVRK